MGPTGAASGPSALPRSGGPAPTERAGLCAFWLAGRCFGLDIGLVGEVVSLEAVTAIPNARPAVRGIFNLRGAPVVVLDLGEVLELGDRAPAGGAVGLVLRAGDIVAAIRVDRVDSIVPPGRGELAPRTEAGEHRAVLGILDDRPAGGRIVTVLDPELLVTRLHALRYLTDLDG